MRTVKEILGGIHGGHILDVATGNGSFIGVLLDSLKDYTDATGIDISTRHRQAFEETFRDKPVQFREMNAAAMDFEPETFDTVTIANSLHHLQAPQEILAEMVRVCRPDGLLIIAEMYRDHQTEEQISHVLLHHWWAAIDTASGICHRETFTRRQIRDLLQQAALPDWQVEEFSQLDSDPLDPELIRWLEGVIDQYIQRAAGLTDEQELVRCGEDLRRRIRRVGFHSAASILAVGRKT